MTARPFFECENNLFFRCMTARFFLRIRNRVCILKKFGAFITAFPRIPLSEESLSSRIQSAVHEEFMAHRYTLLKSDQRCYMSSRTDTSYMSDINRKREKEREREGGKGKEIETTTFIIERH